MPVPHNFFGITQHNVDTLTPTQRFSPLCIRSPKKWTYERKSYLYEHIRRLSRRIFEIDKVIHHILSTWCQIQKNIQFFFWKLKLPRILKLLCIWLFRVATSFHNGFSTPRIQFCGRPLPASPTIDLFLPFSAVPMWDPLQKLVTTTRSKHNTWSDFPISHGSPFSFLLPMRWWLLIGSKRSDFQGAEPRRRHSTRKRRRGLPASGGAYGSEAGHVVEVVAPAAACGSRQCRGRHFFFSLLF